MRPLTTIYRRISVRMWTDRKWREELSNDGRIAWVLMLSHPRLNRLGLFLGGARTIFEDFPDPEGEWPLPRWMAAFDELRRAGMIRVDPAAGRKEGTGGANIWIPNFLRHNPPANPNVVRSWKRDTDEVPEGALRDAAIIEAGQSAAAHGPAFADAFAETFGNPSGNPSPNGSGNPSGNPLPNPSPKASAKPVRNPSANPIPKGSDQPFGNTGSGSVTGSGTGSGSSSSKTDDDDQAREAAPTLPPEGAAPREASIIINEDEPTTDNGNGNGQPKPNRGERLGRSSVTAKGAGPSQIAIMELIETWNRIRTRHNRVVFDTLAPDTIRGLRAALERRSLDGWERLFRTVEESDYLAGREDAAGCSLFRTIELADKIEAGHYAPRDPRTGRQRASEDVVKRVFAKHGIKA